MLREEKTGLNNNLDEKAKNNLSKLLLRGRNKSCNCILDMDVLG
jgi:hypothetical protein